MSFFISITTGINTTQAYLVWGSLGVVEMAPIFFPPKKIPSPLGGFVCTESLPLARLWALAVVEADMGNLEVL